MKKIALLSVLALLSACGSKPADEAVAPEADVTANEAPVIADADAAPAAFAQCATCHQVKKDGRHGVGPNLYGVYGTKAGDLVGFNFSPAMKASGLTWDDATINTYITNPRAMVPGTKMSFAGQADAAKRAEIIAWMKKNS